MFLRKTARIAMLVLSGVTGYLTTEIVTANPAEPGVEPTIIQQPRDAAPTGGVMRQEDFPCQEDEVLGYHSRFGTDYVGCIHVEEFPLPN